MKMHLVLAAAFAGLYSHAAFADPEADFWRQPEPKSFTRSIRPCSDYGSPAEPDSVGRIVRLGSGSHWVNVAYGESVKFIVKSESGLERSFAWRFNVAPDMSHVDLGEVAPADPPVHDVCVFVAPDPRYGGE